MGMKKDSENGKCKNDEEKKNMMELYRCTDEKC